MNHSTPPASQEADETVTRIIFGCEATISCGLQVTNVSTKLESTCLVIGNLPEHVNEDALHEILRPVGDHKLFIMLKALRPMARVEFETPEIASSGVAALDGTCFQGHKITARLEPKRASGEGTVRDNIIQATWFAPTVMAFAHFDIRQQAENAAKRFNGFLIRKREISTRFQVPSPTQTTSFSVIITNLAADATEAEITGLMGCDDVTIQRPQYSLSGSAARLAQELEVVPGTLESFSLVPLPSSAVKLKATAQYRSPDHAQITVNSLNGTKFKFLNNSPLWLAHVQSVKFTLPHGQYFAIEPKITSMRTESSGGEYDRRWYIHQSDTGVTPRVVTIRITAEDTRALGQLKMKMERLLLGEVVFDEDRKVKVWDDELLTRRGRASIGDLARSKGAYAHCDPVKRHISLFAPNDQSQQEARKLILTQVSLMQTARHSIPLSATHFGSVMRTGLIILRERYGKENVSVNISNRILLVRLESDTDLKAVESFVQNLGSSLPEVVGGEAECPVCMCEVTDGVTLGCGHEYCGQCLDHLLQSVSSFPLTCMGDQCQVPLSLGFMKTRLGSSAMDQLLDHAAETYIKQHPEDYRFCPTTDCAHIYQPGPEGSVLQCKGCLMHICPACAVEAHPGFTCAERRAESDPNERAYRKWKEQNDIRPCPRCGVDIQKANGCNHMKCVACWTHICWECMGVFKANDIYEHMRIVHGGIGV